MISITTFTFIFILVLVSISTWGISEWWIYRRFKNKVMNMEKCPFKNPCLKYDEIETKVAVKRIAKLILENLEKEELGKKQVYEDLASGKL